MIIGGYNMNVKNCKGCGKLFNYLSGPPLCPSCREAMEAKFQEVKAYIREHKGVGIAEVAEACSVDAGQIRQWLRDDRLEVTEDSALMLNCESCGAPIRSGRFCERCKANAVNGFNSILNAGKPAPPVKKDTKDSPKMRFLDS